MRFRGDGDESPTARYPGGYVVTLNAARHSVYQAHGKDLYVIARVATNTQPPVSISFPALSGTWSCSKNVVVEGICVDRFTSCFR